MDAIIATSEARGGTLQMIDSTSVRVHQQATAKKQIGDDPIRRSRGRLTTKPRLRTSEHGLSLQIKLSPGKVHHAPMPELVAHKQSVFT